MKLEKPIFQFSGNEVTNRIFADEPVNAPNANLAYVTDLFEAKPYVLTATYDLITIIENICKFIQLTRIATFLLVVRPLTKVGKISLYTK